MRLKASQYYLLRRVRFSVWLLVIVILLLSFISSFQDVENEASDSAFLVASKRIIERASFYKQKWLLAGQPPRLELDEKVLAISQNGWVLPIQNENSVDCDYWLGVLYPEKRVLESMPAKVGDLSKGDTHYRCDYDYGDNRHLVIDLNNKQFSAKVVFVAE
ncbi:MSHA biogenesis protein MshF [Vibrio sinaloensis DSM 21326]|uniref:MSHA biogenesis protein MshF n=1 Tax=Vibrio sinaloensis DSM 21326 TaxID=945550 RepID=E8M2G5_PHOS4|nr:hypothetical protein [Vibrio sinaloensis]EGA71792.1 MSHA biogenesis protein MshF [Vibrio sinaloensis DSM 21326]